MARGGLLNEARHVMCVKTRNLSQHDLARAQQAWHHRKLKMIEAKSHIPEVKGTSFISAVSSPRDLTMLVTAFVRLLKLT